MNTVVGIDIVGILGTCLIIAYIALSPSRPSRRPSRASAARPVLQIEGETWNFLSPWEKKRFSYFQETDWLLNEDLSTGEIAERIHCLMVLQGIIYEVVVIDVHLLIDENGEIHDLHVHHKHSVPA